MQSNEQISPGKAVCQIASQAGRGYMNYGSLAPDISPIMPQGLDFSRPFHQLELQPSDNCPKNFIIFDQNDNRSRIMYYPAYRQQFTYHCPDIDIHAAYLQGHSSRKDTFTENNECSSSLKEDTKDIDALMSLEDEEVEEDDEVISTARTFGNYNCDSPDSCSNSRSKSSKRRVSSTEKSFSECSSSKDDNEQQRQKMKKMVKALRGIVPGADQMTTAALIDEAVAYLKSLKVEVKELGLGNFTN